MGVSFSCPFADQNDVEDDIESIIVKSISLGEDDAAKTSIRSISFNSRNSEPMVMKSLDSGAMKLEGSISLERKELRTVLSFKAPSEPEEHSSKIKGTDSLFPRLDSSLDERSPKHQAALKLQKVYKSFRTRRKLADCAVLVEQSWWNLLDFAELKRSSILFFDIEKHETAISRWSRARTRAAKVGKGLSKNDKAQKLALQHWLEAIDPRHRYGHNLHFYYGNWLHCQSRQPFFYWLDIGEGREVNLVEKCPRSKLQQQCIKYLGPMERKVYEVVVEDGKIVYQQTREILHTTGEFKWIFVLSTSKTLYVGRKKKGTFQHSSFLAGGATAAAGRLVVDDGILKAVWPHSGHYRPTEDNFKDFVSFLQEKSVDLSNVMMSPVEEEQQESLKDQTSFRNNLNEEDRTKDTEVKELRQERGDMEEKCILKRMSSHKGRRSYQLGKQLWCKWTTGAGPRIGCVRDYPAELQLRALEQLSLSPTLSRSQSYGMLLTRKWHR